MLVDWVLLGLLGFGVFTICSIPLFGSWAFGIIGWARSRNTQIKVYPTQVYERALSNLSLISIKLTGSEMISHTCTMFSFSKPTWHFSNPK